MGTPSPGWDSLVRESLASARRRRRRKRRRRQRLMLWLLTVVTTAVLGALALFVKDIARVPAAPAALSASARTVGHGNAAAVAHRVSPRGHQRSAVTRPHVTDAASGLSYRLLPSPWQQGCPSDLNTPMFSWSAGENTVAGHVTIGGSVIAWHGLACSGQLQRQFAYTGPADLEPTAMGLVGALDPAFYGGVPHSRTIQDSSAMQVSGHQAWRIDFGMSYQDGASQGLTWTSERGAVVVVDRGPSQAPAVFYVSVPANLGTQNVTALLGSLQLS